MKTFAPAAAGRNLILTIALFTGLAARALDPPSQPSDQNHPGSSYYPFAMGRDAANVNGREVLIYYPQARQRGQRFPVVIFGHGYTLTAPTYERTFEHLARKGVAVVFPMYDTGWGDHDFARMAVDFQHLADFALKRWSALLDPTRVIFSGHSNGSYVALAAAGVEPSQMLVHPRSAILFATAGAIDANLARVDPNLPVTFVVGDQDDQTPPSLTREIYAALPVHRKQIVLVKSYLQTTPQLIATHDLIRNSNFWGSYHEDAFHYFVAWKLLVGGAWDVVMGTNATNPWIYGPEAASSGIPGFQHQVTRSWTQFVPGRHR